MGPIQRETTKRFAEIEEIAIFSHRIKRWTLGNYPKLSQPWAFIAIDHQINCGNSGENAGADENLIEHALSLNPDQKEPHHAGDEGPEYDHIDLG
jgi:hypothetical protein